MINLTDEENALLAAVKKHSSAVTIGLGSCNVEVPRTFLGRLFGRPRIFLKRYTVVLHCAALKVEGLADAVNAFCAARPNVSVEWHALPLVYDSRKKR